MTRVHCVAQEYWYLRKQRCACGGAYDEATQTVSVVEGRDIDTLRVRCRDCGRDASFEFELSECGPTAIAEMIRKVERYHKAMPADEAALACAPPMERTLKYIGDLGESRDDLALQYIQDAVIAARGKIAPV
jgi:hypothetical protein